MTTTPFQRRYKKIELTSNSLDDHGVKQLDIFARYGRIWSDVLLSCGVTDSALRKVKVKVANTHISKSCRLPVIAIDTAVASYILRDNFHDVNLVVETCEPLNLPLDAFYERVNYDEYTEIVKRCRNYTYACWSDEEMNHPGILRVARAESVCCKSSWSEVSGRKKDNWLRRDVDTTWYEEDWSSGKLIPYRSVDDRMEAWPSGVPFDSSTIFYQAPRCYLQGIAELYYDYIANILPGYVIPDYKPGSQLFCVYARTAERAKVLMTIIERALRKDLNCDAIEQALLSAKHT